ncbi:hypothetical protein H0H92_011874 [Tricholoma furcatifolium]|nr:hypothetical protein H0H92_011874 [Tricholoma furcatifolium]
MLELPEAHVEREKVRQVLASLRAEETTTTACLNIQEFSPLIVHLSHGLAYTVGSALGSTPPTTELCLGAFLVANKAGLTAGARAWSKHFHRSQSFEAREAGDRKEASAGWWGSPSGPVATINEKAIALFWRIINGATWRNLHWLPHQVLVYEVRVLDGYGMRWSRDESVRLEDGEEAANARPWVFRGLLEPQMENGHEIGWRH